MLRSRSAIAENGSNIELGLNSIVRLRRVRFGALQDDWDVVIARYGSIVATADLETQERQSAYATRYSADLRFHFPRNRNLAGNKDLGYKLWLCDYSVAVVCYTTDL